MLVKLYVGDGRITWTGFLRQFVSKVKNNVLFHLPALYHGKILSIWSKPCHVLRNPITVSQKFQTPFLLGDKEVNCPTITTCLDHIFRRHYNMAI